jgi:hypothetical protein
MDVGSFRPDFVSVTHRGAALPLPSLLPSAAAAAVAGTQQHTAASLGAR